MQKPKLKPDDLVPATRKNLLTGEEEKIMMAIKYLDPANLLELYEDEN